jgi:hypothetical protein
MWNMERFEARYAGLLTERLLYNAYGCDRAVLNSTVNLRMASIIPYDRPASSPLGSTSAAARVRGDLYGTKVLHCRTSD